MSVFAKHRDSDNLVVSLTTTDPGSEAGYTIKNTTFNFPFNWSGQTWNYVSDNNYSKVSNYSPATDYSPDSESVSGTINMDFKRKKSFKCLLQVNGNLTIDAPQNSQNTEEVVLIIDQDETGGHSITFDSNYWITSSSLSLNTGSNKRNTIYFYQDSGKFFQKTPAVSDYI